VGKRGVLESMGRGETTASSLRKSRASERTWSGSGFDTPAKGTINYIQMNLKQLNLRLNKKMKRKKGKKRGKVRLRETFSGSSSLESHSPFFS